MATHTGEWAATSGAWTVEQSLDLKRCADALEQIASVLTLAICTPAEDVVCAHPTTEREVVPGSTMGHLEYRCKACGQPCPEPGA